MSRLPIEPLREWIEGQLRSTDKVSLADRMGVDPRQIYSWLNEFERVQLDVADQALLNAGVHLWDVYPELYETSSELNRPPRILLHDELILQARNLHDLGESLFGVARELLEASGYSCAEALWRALIVEFDNQGWPRRTHTTKQRYAEGWLPSNRCMAVTGKKRERCRKAARNGHYCYHHDPKTRDCVVALAHRTRSRWEEGHVAIAPFARWLRGRVAELGSQTEVARQIGTPASTVSRWLSGKQTIAGKHTTYRYVKRETVERALETFGDSFDDLYPEEEAA